MTKSPDQRGSSTDVRNVTVILFLCLVFAYLRWLKLDTLDWGDPGRWLFEGQRAATGEIPYRDFLWLYPPLGVLMLGGTMKLFGVAFAVAQVFVDLASLAVVLFAYALIRLLLPAFLHLPVIFCLIAIGGTSLTFFPLFSFFTYVPSLQMGAAGVLLLVVGVVSYIRTGRMSAGCRAAIILGAFVAAYSKPESLLAAYCTLGLLALIDRRYWFAQKSAVQWFQHYAKVAVACVGPALLAYLWMGAITGFRNMWWGLTGFGLASTVCSWWPTGVGLFGAAASLGEAAFIAAMLSLIRCKQFTNRFGRAYPYALAAGLAGVFIYAWYVVYTNWDRLTGSRSILDKLRATAPSTVWSGAVLLPVMWLSVVLWFWLLSRWVISRGRTANEASFILLVLLTGPVLMSTRAWFNWQMGLTTSVPAICYPFFILIAPYLIWRFFALAGPGPGLDRGIRGLPGVAVVSLLLAYSLVRIAAGYSSQLSNGPYQNLETLAGDIRLSNFAVDSEIYRFVINNSRPGDPILVIPYGGGMNVATHRPSPLFSTLFDNLRLPDDFLEKDLDRIRARPPKIVIAENRPNFGVYYGLEGCGCAFPHLVWSPPTSSVVRGKMLPAVVYIQQNYRVSKIVGPRLLLVPK